MTTTYRPDLTGYRSQVQEVAYELDDALQSNLCDSLLDRLMNPMIEQLCSTPSGSFADLHDKLDIHAAERLPGASRAAVWRSIRADVSRLADAEDAA
jgi:hypothetical protein